MSEKNFVTYEEFGAVGDGKTNDFPAIYAAHNYANEKGLTVKAAEGKIYYISDTRIDGEVKSATIKTNVIWTGAEFIIDDSLYSTHENFGMYVKSIFEILSDYPMQRIINAAFWEKFLAKGPEKGAAEIEMGISINSDYPMQKRIEAELFEKILAAGLNRETTKIDMGLGYPALIIPYNNDHGIYRRRGYGQWAGEPMHEVILLDKDGNVDPETPVMWDYTGIDYIDVIRTDIAPITVEGGKFTNVACNTDCVVRDESGKPIRVYEPYIARGLRINRSYTTLKNVLHYMKGEISFLRQKKGEIGAPYRGFFTSAYATHVTFDSCVMTGKRCYQKAWIGKGFSGTMGTYDLSGNAVNKIVFKNCTQSNFWVTIDENGEFHPAKPGDPGAVLSLSQMPNDEGAPSRIHWGVGGTNYCKNMEYIGCTLTRYDAHQGLYNGKVIDSSLVSFALTGCGHMEVKNLTLYAESHTTNGMFGMRSDYGAIWNGTIDVDGLNFYGYTKKSSHPYAPVGDFNPIGVIGHTYCNWDYGYECLFPSVSINNLKMYDIETGEPIPEGYEINLVRGNMLTEPALHLKTTLKSHPIFPDVDKDGDGFVDGTKIPYDDVVSRDGIVDESSYDNLNPVVPPKYLKVTGNECKYVYRVNDMSSFEGITDGGFFANTEFISENETYVGTNHCNEKTETFKFISHKGE